MTITSNAAIVQYGDPIVAIESNDSIANGSFVGGTNPVTLEDFVPFADLVLNLGFVSPPTNNGAIHVYRRDLNVDGTSHAPIPTNNFKQTYVGSFLTSPNSASQVLSLTSVPVSRDQEFYLENASGTSTSASTPLVLKVIPKTFNGKV